VIEIEKIVEEVIELLGLEKVLILLGIIRAREGINIVRDYAIRIREDINIVR
jgi:hypothetical protein